MAKKPYCRMGGRPKKAEPYLVRVLFHDAATFTPVQANLIAEWLHRVAVDLTRHRDAYSKHYKATYH